MNIPGNISSTRSSGKEMWAVGAFVAVSLVAPLVVGEMYPFTISPMFCDQPSQYCTYRLTDESGKALDLDPFGLHLVYDGNPPGLGMGVESSPRLHEFGHVPEIEAVVMHVREKAREIQPGCNEISIEQTVVCCNGTCPEKEVREAVVSIAHWKDRAGN